MYTNVYAYVLDKLIVIIIILLFSFYSILLCFNPTWNNFLIPIFFISLQ